MFHHYDSEEQFDGRNFVNLEGLTNRNDYSQDHTEANRVTRPPGVDDGIQDPLSPDPRKVGKSVAVDEGEHEETIDIEHLNGLNFSKELLECARLKLFPGSLLSLSSTLLLLMCCRTHSCSTAFIDELFKSLSKSILPMVNSLVRSWYFASKKL